MARKSNVVSLEEQYPEIYREQASNKEQITDSDKIKTLASRWLSAAVEKQDPEFNQLKMEEVRDLYRGRHFIAGTGRSTNAKVVNNQFSRIIDTLTPILRDSRGRCGAQPRDPANRAFADIVDPWLDYYNDESGAKTLDYLSQRDMVKQGSSIIAVEWDEFACGGDGDVRERDVDYRRIFFDPLMRSHDIDHSRWVIEELVPDPYRCEVEFGIAEEDYDFYSTTGSDSRIGWAKRFQPSFLRNEKVVIGGVQQMSGAAFTSTSTSWQRRSYGDRYIGGPRIYRVWFRNKDNPKGLRATIINGEVHEVIPNPHPHGDFPYVMYQDRIIDGTPWAIGVGFNMATLQHEVNRNFNTAIDMRDLVGNPPLKLPDNISIKEKDWRPRPGWIVKGRNAEELNAIGYMTVPGVDQVVLSMMNLTVQQMETHAGLSDGQMGRKPEGQVTARVYGQLMEASSGRIREEVRHVEVADERRGQRRIDLMLHNFTEDRLMRTSSQKAMQSFQRIRRLVELGEDGQPAGHYFEAVEHQGHNPDGSPKGRAAHSTLHPELDIRIYTESSLPLTARQKLETLIDMHSQGLVDQEEVLNACSWINSFDLMERMKKAAAAAGQKGPQVLMRLNVNANAGADKVGAIRGGQMIIDRAAQMLLANMLQGQDGPNPDAAPAGAVA